MSIILKKSICNLSYRKFSSIYQSLQMPIRVLNRNARITTTNLTHLNHSKILQSQYIHTTSVQKLFWEPDKKGAGYDKFPSKKFKQKQLILDGLKELKQEILLWKEEVKEHLISDPVLVFRPGEVDVVWQFSTEKDLEQWVTTSDKDNGEGQSQCQLELSQAGYGMFNGNVQSQVPLDGKIKRSGYCNIKSLRARKSFKREIYLDWSQYNTLVLRIRGDGRSYLLNIATEGEFDVWWFDTYNYVLYTRGGPHWQTARIPFSKFFLSSKGRIQDKQGAIPLNKVTSFGLSVAGRGGHEGAFQLEIDYIGLEFDPANTERFAYEMYKMPKYTLGT